MHSSHKWASGEVATPAIMARFVFSVFCYLFFELVEPERYPDRAEDGAWMTPRFMVIPIDVVSLLVCWYQNDEMTRFDEYCVSCDCGP